MKVDWGSLKWEAVQKYGQGYFKVRCEVPSLDDNPEIGMEILADLETNFRSHTHFKDLKNKLKEARLVGAKSVDIDELLEWLG